ncbi:MAG TPA: GntR family transcriptional regulator, partial [Chitinophagaceae bacterium]|nr:GntR family transcriptional regulator [Chitinophagaceae bacterium]
MIQKLLEISFKKGNEYSPLYLQLESEIIQLICRGILKPRQALPSSRELAQHLQLNRKTVVAAYEELDAQGWVETRERSGVYISSQLPDTSARKMNQNRKKWTRSRQPAYTLIKRSRDVSMGTDPGV